MTRYRICIDVESYVDPLDLTDPTALREAIGEPERWKRLVVLRLEEGS